MYILLLWLVCTKTVMLIMLKKVNQHNIVLFSVSGVIRKLASPRVDWSVNCPVRDFPVHELTSLQVGNRELAHPQVVGNPVPLTTVAKNIVLT